MCCSLPRVSVKRKSTHLALDDLIRSSNLFDIESLRWGNRILCLDFLLFAFLLRGKNATFL